MQRPTTTLLLLAASLSAACGGGASDATAPARAPATSGTVLVMDGGTRATAPAALLGFVHGLHTIVLAGDRVFAGMTALETTPGADGSRAIALRGGVTAQLVPAGEGFELRFPGGETIALRPRPAGSN